MSHPISWWEYTGKYTPFVDHVSSPIMRNLATGEEISQRDLPIGACWDVNQPPDGDKENQYLYPTGADGKAIACKLPNGHVWHIDARATNCTMKDDKEHRCWVRHGTVGDPLHVDKNGHTCAAGAGSIQFKDYHGFLHNGELT